MDDSQELAAPAPNRRWLRIAGVAMVCLAVAAGAWLVTSLLRADDEESREVKLQPVAPIALSADGLRRLAGDVGQPIYWGGPKEGVLYELKRNADGAVFIRYLPEDLDAGAPDGPYLVVATYPYENAYSALQNTQGDRFELPRGGLAVMDTRTPSSIHVAFPNSNYQAEVYVPSPERALVVARSGDVRPVG